MRTAEGRGTRRASGRRAPARRRRTWWTKSKGKAQAETKEELSKDVVQLSLLLMFHPRLGPSGARIRRL